jgi:ring-1,2-phenylacetyl-CoA epoxidase subunit PaaD
MAQMQDDVCHCLEQAGLQAEVITCLSPAWSSDWITVEAKAKLLAYGIAPPHHQTSEAGQDRSR